MSHRDGKLGAFKPGLGMLVAGTGVPVIPCHLSGAYEAMPPHARIPRWKKIAMRVGPALSFEREPNSREGWENVARDAHQAVSCLALTGLHQINDHGTRHQSGLHRIAHGK